MPKRDPKLMKELKAAMNARDMQAFGVVMGRFQNHETAIDAANHLFTYEISVDTLKWWLLEQCDLPHEPESLMDEAYLMATRIIMDRERSTDPST